jgi:hypothetical protein
MASKNSIDLCVEFTNVLNKADVKDPEIVMEAIAVFAARNNCAICD